MQSNTYLKSLLSHIPLIPSLSRCSVIFCNGDNRSGNLVYGYDRNNPQFPHPGKEVIFDHHPPYKTVIETKQPVIVNNTESDLGKEWHEKIRDKDIGSIMLLPLVADNKTLGIMNMSWAIGNRERDNELFLMLKTIAGLLTESVKYTNQLETIFNNIAHGIILIDRDYRIIYLNNFAIPKDKRRDEIIGKHCYTIYEKRRTFCRECSVNVTLIKDDVAHSEKRYKRHNGNEKILKISSFPMYDAGKVTSVIVFTRDITKIKDIQGEIDIWTDKLAKDVCGLMKVSSGFADQVTKEVFGLSYSGKIPDFPPHDRMILEMIAKGYDNKKITNKLSISNNTLKTYLRRIFKKLNANNRTEAVIIALRMGLISLMK